MWARVLPWTPIRLVEGRFVRIVPPMTAHPELWKTLRWVAVLITILLLGWLGARAGNAPPMRAIVRVTFWGAAAMLATALIGRAVGVAV